ncbi:class I SAM-dependent methyltransferase [uncultured Dokdonia sp.]|uniref:class I SAM-dependent DNA methyltransferase n=1 Tax=uncultured Dokdonia sp. TaxID=575653 RepID=UPI00262ECA64|nr:class I SAM-dependent methyltransferase [uncultured Dokdonia sp.]
MDPYQETPKTWNTIAKRYEEVFMNLDIYNASYDRFCELINNDNASILEIGCGPGNITKYLLLQHPNYKIRATDVSSNMIALAQKNNPTGTFQEIDARDIASIKKSFHGIMCGFIIPYLSKDDIIHFIKNTYTLLNRNGILYLSFVSGDYRDSGFITGSTGDRTYFYYHTTQEIKKLLLSQGFTIKEHLMIPYKKTKDVFETHTLLIARK